MGKKITELYILTGFFCMLIIGKENINLNSAIFNICFVIVLILMQMCKEMLNLNKYLSTLVQVLVILSGKSFGALSVELFLPIILFEVFKSSFLNFTILGCIIFVDFLYFGGDVINYIIFSIIINLYLYECDTQYNDKVELKELNKLQSAKRHYLHEKMINMHRYMEQSDITAALKERNYMAQKVHDHLGHRITSSIMQLEVTKETLGVDNETSKKYLLSAMEGLRSGMEEIREFLRNTKPSEKQVSFEEIKNYLLSFQYSTNIKTHMDINGDISRFKLAEVNVIIQNLREALTNAAKYSEADNLYFSINMYNKFARVEIRDDGIGFKDMHKSLGLKGMEERIENINGKIQFYNDDGFVINMIIRI